MKRFGKEMINFHIFSYIFIYFHTFSYLYISFHIFSYIFICFHIVSYIFIYFHIFSYIFCCVRLLVCCRGTVTVGLKFAPLSAGQGISCGPERLLARRGGYWLSWQYRWNMLQLLISLNIIMHLDDVTSLLILQGLFFVGNYPGGLAFWGKSSGCLVI